MSDFIERLKSRKFLLILGGVLSAVGGALTEAIDWATAINAIVTLILAYLGVEGAGDIVERYNYSKNE